ncbi:unnamed protein product [Peronospora effusa]|nr:unnamed protein product [Peronospora effusa]
MDVPAVRMSELGVTSTKDLDLELRLSLYGLKQAGRLWSHLLHQRLVEGGYTQCISYSCLYYRRVDSELVISGVYVDDTLVTGMASAVVKQFFRREAVPIDQKLGPVAKFPGMRVKKTANGRVAARS